jgi:hypothetical protein
MNWPQGFRVQPIQTLTTSYYIPPTLMPPKPIDLKTSATALTSVIYVQGRPTEVMLGGVKMGSRFPPSPRGASCLCRARMGQDFFDFLHRETSRLLHLELTPNCTYAELKRKVGKRTEPLRRSVKEALGQWITDDSDGDFTLGGRHHLDDGLLLTSEPQLEEPDARPSTFPAC